MTIAVETLPWDALSLRDVDIPWPALKELADAVATSDEALRRLLDVLRCAYNRHELAAAGTEIDWTDLSDMGALAVLDLAARRLSPAAARLAGEALMHCAFLAGTYDDDFGLEDTSRVAKHLSAAGVEAALNEINERGHESESWIHVHSILEEAATGPDELRQRVIAFCRSELDTLPNPEHPWSLVMQPASVLARLRDVESLPRLEQIYKRSGSGDVKWAIDLLRGEPEAKELEESQRGDDQRPVEEWLPERIQETRDWLEGRGEDDSGNDFEDDSEDEWGDDWEEDEDVAGFLDALGRPANPTMSLLDRNELDQFAGREAEVVRGDYVAAPIGRSTRRVGRNEPCPCGSGKKYKKCCAMMEGRE